MKKISVLLTKYSDKISTLLYYLGGRGYTHVSIALDATEDRYYSFNYKGFCEESLSKHRKRGVHKSVQYELAVSDEAYRAMRERLAVFLLHRQQYAYTRLGLLCCLLHLPFVWKNHYFCSQFVAELLQDAGGVPLGRRANLTLPNHFQQILTHSDCLCEVVHDVV